MSEAPQVRAAGGLVVRDGRVAVIHRPRHDDWSLPKGKLEPGEGWEDAALREVAEETGLRCALGEELAPARYRVGDALKEVRYWRMEVAAETGGSSDGEVDELVWATPEEALGLLTYEHDRALVATLARLR